MPDKHPSESRRFPRRQASFESPREVPLPSPPLTQPEPQNYFSSLPPQEDQHARMGNSAQESPVDDGEDGYEAGNANRMASDKGGEGRRHAESNTIYSDLKQKIPFDRFSSASLPLPSQIPFYALPRVTRTESPASDPASNPDVSRSSLTTASSSDRSGARSSVADSISSSSSSSSSNSSSSLQSSSSSSARATASKSTTPASDCSFSSSCQPTSRSHNDSRSPTTRSVSPFRAPQPPPSLPTAPIPQPTAMRRFMVPSNEPVSFPPPEPPIILPAENTHDPSQRRQPPYAPFLSHAPPPPDSWIEIESAQTEYRLHVRLPGFNREGITLATKRRRILHVVADSWENGGGHFERRIAFGYDADLVQVRAEFDGIMLRITIPRRISPVVWQSSRSGFIGRA